MQRVMRFGAIFLFFFFFGIVLFLPRVLINFKINIRIIKTRPKKTANFISGVETLCQGFQTYMRQWQIPHTFKRVQTQIYQLVAILHETGLSAHDPEALSLTADLRWG